MIDSKKALEFGRFLFGLDLNELLRVVAHKSMKHEC